MYIRYIQFKPLLRSVLTKYHTNCCYVRSLHMTSFLVDLGGVSKANMDVSFKQICLHNILALV